MGKIEFYIERFDFTLGDFNWDEDYEKIFLDYNKALKYYMTDKEKALNKLIDMLEIAPEFFPALNSIGSHYSDKGEIEAAIIYYEKGYSICNQIIPQDFEGDFFSNSESGKSFIKILKRLGECYIELKKHKEAIPILIRFLKHDGSRMTIYKIGYLYILTGNFLEAKQFFENNIDHTPCKYLYGLLLFEQNKFIESIVHTCQAIILEEDIFEMIITKNIDAYYNSELRDFIKITKELWNNKNYMNFVNQIYDSTPLKRFREEYRKLEELQIKTRYQKKIKSLEDEKNKLFNSLNNEFALEIFKGLNKHLQIILCE